MLYIILEDFSGIDWGEYFLNNILKSKFNKQFVHILSEFNRMKITDCLKFFFYSNTAIAAKIVKSITLCTNPGSLVMENGS